MTAPSAAGGAAPVGAGPRALAVGAAVLPGVALAVAGLFHPAALAPSTAAQWTAVHLVLLPLFPLLAAAPVVLLRGERGVLAALARVAAYAYAVFYTGLDALAGIAAGVVTERVQGGSRAALDLRALGADLGLVGGTALLVAAALTGAVLVRRHGRAALPGAVLLVGGAAAFRTAHVYWPTGGLALLAVAAGGGLLALVSAGKG